ncbi:MAG: hypothetical protein GY916_14840 [Gammaproteobacteria bacterium]|nr:hypothetical protein [Gammaproteobacteria bacterium]
MLISEAFKTFNATLNNIQWSVSAINSDNELVLSLWEHFFEKRSKGTMTYTDSASRWSGAGNNEFRKNFQQAYEDNLKVRAIIAKSKKPDVITEGGSGANLGNTFHPKSTWIGKITQWDGDNFEIEFTQEK